MSSVPDFEKQAREALDESAEMLSGGSLAPEELARIQATATVGLGYAILAIWKDLSIPRT